MLAAALLLTTALAQAQTTYTVPNGVPFTDPTVTPAPVPAAPASGSIIDLQGSTASITSSITLPGTLTINVASGGSTITPGASGMAFKGGSSATTLNITGGDVTFSGANSGGVITPGSGGSTINVSGGITFEDNTAELVDGAGSSGNTLTINAASFTEKNNTGSGIGGSAPFNSQLLNLNITGDVLISDNTVVNGDDGAIHDLTEITAGGNVSITSNTAGATGGAIRGNNTSITGASITLGDNTAGTNGGVIYVVSGNNSWVATSGGITVENNTATTGSGGAIFVQAGGTSFTATGGIEVSNNTAASSGGAIYATGAVVIGNTSSTLTLGGATASDGNTAAGNGGAIYSGGDTTLFGSTISNNTATAGNGGAVDAQGNFTLTSTTTDTISTNKAGGLGGAIYVGNNATLNAAAGGITFSGNTQGSGANAIYLNNASAASTTTLTLNAQGYPITFFDPIQNNPANGLIVVTATGGDSVIFDGSQYTTTANQQSLIDGATTVTSGTTFAVRNNAIYGALAAEVGGTASRFTVDNNATLAGGTTFADGTSAVHADTFTLAGTLNIAGNDAPGTAAGTQASFSQFTVSSSATDTLTGGTVVFNTCLNNAATQLSDQLALDLNGGTTTGTATIQINPVAGCVGADTQNNGILLVNVSNGTTAANAFQLAGPVEADGHTYGLAQVGGSWYLQSPAPPPALPSAVVPTPLDARWMLVLAAALLAAGGAVVRRRRRA